MQQSIQQYYLPFLPLLLGVSYSVSCSQCSPKVLLSSKFDDLHRFMCLKTRSPAGGAIFIYFSDFGGGHLGIGPYSLAQDGLGSTVQHRPAGIPRHPPVSAIVNPVSIGKKIFVSQISMYFSLLLWAPKSQTWMKQLHLRSLLIALLS